MRSTRARLLVAGLLPLALLTACGDDSSKADKSASSSSSPASPQTVAPDQASPISNVSVSTAKPNAPTVTVAKPPFRAAKTTTKINKAGAGAAVGDKDIAYVSYVAVNGTTGKTIESTFGKPNASFNLADKQTFPGLLKALKGQKVGTEMTVAVPPADGFGAQGAKQLGIGANDTMVFYMKVNDRYPLLTEVKGTQAASESGLPKVSVPAGPVKQATITFDKGSKPPTTLKSQTLIKGDGPKVLAGQQLLVNYTGQIWGGKVFDAAAKQGQPAAFQIGAGKVIPGWDKTLVGQTVGSRLLLSIPPADGYGKQGNPQGGIKGTDTLVFVVDILGAM
ncbi:FKBP-type peptidyl-prolyl cis-trans isomerase [Luteipulveratus sp. YIM 133132]|uniref:FKBP-type peptidyl-prolyl cis-trans isomerase n=1 Tax=Luteipulveratus flavus TaxID=3031728 RepID=UPI0023B113EB|nr:FKBP-type peptidyl-prolyl cis-trans isomerase [Luteipulveratus sp. YIM 133132]MDE9367420.1 FKBP-type peptidyl-prolyl cis-trans isomerase [Luteipulveratus sp. YIM 133132]